MRSKLTFVVVIIIAIAVIAGIFNFLIREGEESPTSSESPSFTILPRKLVLRITRPTKNSEELPVEYLPRLCSWNLWRGTSSGDRMCLSSLPRSMEVLYRVNVSANIGGVLAEPVIEGDYVYLGDHGGVYALNKSTGELIWGVEVYSDSLEGRTTSYPQPVYRWRALALSRFVEAYGLGKYFYVATSSSASGEGDAYLLALNKQTGELVWEAKLLSGPNSTSATSITSNMIVADSKIFVGSVEGYVFCVSEDGEILWRTSLGGIIEGLAYGDGILYAMAYKLYAVNVGNGEILWWWDYGSWPIYKEGRIIVGSYGDIVVLNKEGEVLWRKGYGAGGNVEGNPYIAVGDQAIYVSRTLGERPRDIQIVGMNGSLLGKFQILPNEDAVAPIASKDVIVLPVKSENNNYSKLYILWRKGEKLSENMMQVREKSGWWPVATAAYGEVYVVVDPFTLYKLGDNKNPRINNISVELNESSRRLSIYVKAYDSESALYRVLLVYSINSSKWIYRDMEIARKYFMEPVGGYGYREETYRSELDVEPDTIIEFYVVVIDNVGNYVMSNIYAYEVVEE